MLEAALEAGFSAAGVDSMLAGPMPTPAIAYLTRALRLQAGVVISASHNPFQDNGIKFFSGEGRKLSLEKEREIEWLTTEDGPRPTGEDVGAVESLPDAPELYVEGVLGRLGPRAGGMKVLLDCANGAAVATAPAAFRRLGAGVTVVGAEPDGKNINEGCGSTHVEALDASGYDVAFAFDGDADRVLAVDERGGVVDGDRILAILARDLQERGLLGGGLVVTVMSNLGFFKAMDALGIPYGVTPVGDRHVAEEMLRAGASLGGEQSGHVILSEHATTGDGLVTALALLDVMVRSGKTLSELATVMEVYPQKLINVPVGAAGSAKAIAALEPVGRAVAGAEERLGDEGRILLRPSGTEPVVRVMVEHEDEAVCGEVCAEVAGVVEAAGREYV
jgi:phosphoglucosamine mutase